MKAFVVERISENEFKTEVKEVETPQISENEVLIKTSYSSLNFKDALSSIGNKGVTRNFPHITGIDVAGEVFLSKSKDFQKGDKVLATGYDLGMNTNGGHSEFVKVPSSWIVPLPKNLTEKQSMIFGTAGLTAALSINEILNSNIKKGEVLVTGATGGVGSITVSILNKLGFNVTAVSGKKEKIEFLKNLGASEVILREDFNQEDKRPLSKGKYDAVVDTVGGDILAQALKEVKYDGVVTCCGLTSSPELNTTVFPFILRGIRLIGIDSVECKLEKKKDMWEKLANEFKIDFLEKLTQEITLEEIKEAYEKLLSGKAVGRYLLKF